MRGKQKYEEKYLSQFWLVYDPMLWFSGVGKGHSWLLCLKTYRRSCSSMQLAYKFCRGPQTKGWLKKHGNYSAQYDDKHALCDVFLFISYISEA